MEHGASEREKHQPTHVSANTCECLQLSTLYFYTARVTKTKKVWNSKKKTTTSEQYNQVNRCSWTPASKPKRFLAACPGVECLVGWLDASLSRPLVRSSSAACAFAHTHIPRAVIYTIKLFGFFCFFFSSHPVLKFWRWCAYLFADVRVPRGARILWLVQFVSINFRQCCNSSRWSERER